MWSVSDTGSAALDSEPRESLADAREPVTVGRTPASMPDSMEVLVDTRAAVVVGGWRPPPPPVTQTDISAHQHPLNYASLVVSIWSFWVSAWFTFILYRMVDDLGQKLGDLD